MEVKILLITCRNYIEKKVNTLNYYIFIFFIMKFKNCSYLKYIEKEIILNLELENLGIGNMGERAFEEKYSHYVLLNALNQSIEIGYKDFMNYVISKEKGHYGETFKYNGPDAK